MMPDKKAKAKTIAPFIDAMKEVGNRSRECLFPRCKESAIDSHILQHRGILSLIAEENIVYQANSNIYSETINTFQKKPVNGALTFKGFCGFHDTDIFKKIEKVRPFDINNYESLLLLVYRSILFVYREREIIMELQKWILESKFYLKQGRNEIEALQYQKDKVMSFESIKNQKEFFENHLTEIQSEKFVFIKREVPLLPICCCQFLAIQLLTGFFLDKPEMGIFFTIIPFNNKSLIIFGYKRDEKDFINGYLKDKIELPEKDFIYFINTLFLSYGNDWVCSPKFYFDKIRPHYQELSRIMTWLRIGWPNLTDNPLKGISPLNILKGI